MRFREFIESQDLNLPSIPHNMVRLTHFTSPDIAMKIGVGGDDFKFKDQLDSTTDSFSSNEEIANLIMSGSFEKNFNRSHFGSAVLLIDMPNKYHRTYRAQLGGKVPNQLIVGFMDKNKQFHSNPNYNPQSADPPKPPPSPLMFSVPKGRPVIRVPQPQAGHDNNLDVF